MHLGIRAGDLEMKINTKVKNSSSHFFFALQFATCHVLMYLPRVPGGVSEIACKAISVEISTHGSDLTRQVRTAFLSCIIIETGIRYLFL